MISEDDIFAKIYQEFHSLRNLGMSRRDLISFIESKNKKSEANRILSFLQGVKKLLSFGCQIKSIADLEFI